MFKLKKLGQRAIASYISGYCLTHTGINGT